MTTYTQLLIDPLAVAEIFGGLLTAGYLTVAALRPIASRSFIFRNAVTLNAAPRRTLHSLRTLAPQDNPAFVPGRLLSARSQTLSDTAANGKPSRAVNNTFGQITELQLLRDYKLALQSHLARFFEVGQLISSPKRSLTRQRVARFA